MSVIICFVLFFYNSKTVTSVSNSISWAQCFIVTTQNDTLYGHVKGKQDFSAEGGILPGEKILFRTPEGNDTRLDISNIKELYMPDNVVSHRKYLVLGTNPRYPGRYRVYRVISDGACKLLYSEAAGSAGKMVYNTAMGGQLYSTSMKATAEEYNIYYNYKFTLVYADDDLNLASRSKSDCVEVFKNCPALVEKISGAKSKLPKLPVIIEAFNECAGN